MFSKPVGVSIRPSKDYPRVRGISGCDEYTHAIAFCRNQKKRPGAESERRAGIGHVAVGMARQGDDLQLTQYDERSWRANFFYPTGQRLGGRVRIRAERAALRRILEWRTCIRHRGGHHAQ